MKGHDFNHQVIFGGKTIIDSDKKGSVHKEWIPEEKIKLKYYEKIIPGFKNHQTNQLKLWQWENND